MMTGNCRRLAAVATVVCLAVWGGSARADWTACQRQPTRACLLDEALRADGAPLAGKDRLEVLNVAGAAVHPEYATASDIDEALRQAKPTPAEFRYAALAIRWLVAAKRQQQAADLVASFRGPFQHLALLEFIRASAKADDLDAAGAFIDRMTPTLEQIERGGVKLLRTVEFTKAAAEAGKINEALLILMSVQVDNQFFFPDFQFAEMEMAVAAAYARRGDATKAQRLLVLAGQGLEKARTHFGANATELVRFSLISLSALRGDAEAVRTALRQPAPDPTDRSAMYSRGQGYQRVVNSLLQTRQFALALEVAKAAPDSARDASLLLVNGETAANGRIDDARAVLTLFSDKMEPKTRAIAVRNVAVAMAKAGKLDDALKLAAQEGDPVGRRAILFAIAEALPQ
jgi:hypothetical protein